MMRSPLFATILALFPLVALAFPLVKVLKPAPVVQVEKVEETKDEDFLEAYVIFRAAHPFHKAVVNCVLFEEGDVEKELIFDPNEPIDVVVEWPEGTPYSAVLIEIQADGQETKSKTLWGTGTAVGELDFKWEVAE